MVDFAVLEEIAEIFASLRDVDAALGRFLRLARAVAGTHNGAIYLRSEAMRDFKRWIETPTTPTLDMPPEVIDAMFAGAAYRIVSLDDPQLARYRAVEAAREAGLHAAVGLPLRYGDELVGVLGLGFPTLDAIDPDRMRTLTTVARFPAAAVVHARTQEVSARRARLAVALRRFGEQALGGLEALPALHRLILDAAVEITGSDQASITEVRDERLRVLAGVGKDERYVGTEAPAALMVEALDSDAPYFVPDVARADPAQLLVKLARKNGAGSFLAVAMRRQARVFGHLFCGAVRPHAFHAEEIEAMRILASMAAAVLEQRSAQAAAERQARRLAATVEHLPIMIELFGADDELALANDAARALRERLGVPAGSAVQPFPGLALLELDGSPVAAHELPCAAARLGVQPAPREVVLARPDGARLATLLMAAAPILGSDGELESVVLGCQDVSKLHELARQKDRFLRVAAHELRTPITALSATAQLLDLDPDAQEDPERRRRLLARVGRQSERLNRLVEQLLDSVRAQAGELPLNLAEIDLVALCRDVVEMTMPGDGPRAQVQAAEPVVGRFDPLRIEQVVTNLLSNAQRYGGGAEVVVAVAREGARARIAVSDRGSGIPPHELELLFTPFFRGANAQETRSGGLGLGLHIAREIVRRHGGEISVASREQGGTTFTVTLPLA